MCRPQRTGFPGVVWMNLTCYIGTSQGVLLSEKLHTVLFLTAVCQTHKSLNTVLNHLCMCVCLSSACDEWTVLPRPGLHRDVNRFGHSAVVNNGWVVLIYIRVNKISHWHIFTFPWSFPAVSSKHWASRLTFLSALRFHRLWFCCVDCLWIDLFIPALYLVSVYWTTSSLVTSPSAGFSEALCWETVSLPPHLLSTCGCVLCFSLSVTFFTPSMYRYSVYLPYASLFITLRALFMPFTFWNRRIVSHSHCYLQRKENLRKTVKNNSCCWCTLYSSATVLLWSLI